VRILVVNKFWYRRAGLERVMFDEIGWLEEAGHEVAHFSTQHPENDSSPWSSYFVPYLEIGPASDLTTRKQLLAAVRMFWNREAAWRFARLLADFRPDVIHVHGIHRQISPSILVVAKRAGVPVVQSLHDYHPICSAGDLLLGGQQACDPPRCGSMNVLPCVLYGCVQHSRAKSALAGAEFLSRRWVVRAPALVTAFISPSKYLADVVSAAGGVPVPVHVLPNAVPCESGSASPAVGNYFVYAGRLSREKGLATLFQAVGLAGIDLVVAGDGPLKDALAAAKPPAVTMLGRVDGDAVNGLLRGCRAAVVPSEWAENAPMAVLEPMALGRAVIASRMGGIPEQVRDGIDGILTTAGDALELAAAMKLLVADEELAVRLGRSARERVASGFSPQRHIEGLLRIYASVLSAGGTPPAY
jgi:glycosyltransferase involved in cell wall biosynthesis